MMISSQLSQTDSKSVGPAATDPEPGTRVDPVATARPNDRLRGKLAAVLVFSHYPSDPRPRRAAEALVEQGMIVEVICLKNRDDEAAREVVNGVRIRRVPFRRKRGGKLTYLFQYFSFILVCLFSLAFRSLTRRYHLVHVHNMPDVLVFSALVPKLRGAKVILDLHDPMPELMTTIYGFSPGSRVVRLLVWLEKLSIAFADNVLTVNLACKRIFTSRSCRPEKLQVIMNSPDEAIFDYREAALTQQRDSGKAFVIMCHGSIVERHGLDIAVEAVRLIRGSIPQIKLRV